MSCTLWNSGEVVKESQKLKKDQKKSQQNSGLDTASMGLHSKNSQSFLHVESGSIFQDHLSYQMYEMVEDRKFSKKNSDISRLEVGDC